MELDKKMIDDVIIHASDVTEEIDFPTMIVGILTKYILPYSTVLGFTRSGDFLNRDLLWGKTEVFTIIDLNFFDIVDLIYMATDRQEDQRREIMKQK